MTNPGIGSQISMSLMRRTTESGQGERRSTVSVEIQGGLERSVQGDYCFFPFLCACGDILNIGISDVSSLTAIFSIKNLGLIVLCLRIN